MTDFSTELTRLRKASGYSLAALANRTGFARRSLQQWEKGSYLPPRGFILRVICDAIGADRTQRRALVHLAVKTHVDVILRRYVDDWGEDLAV